jgi:adenosylmethionine---8-amino-7-oxononanoate aminotransferase
MTEEKNYIAKDREVIWHPFTPLEGVQEPLLVESAKGVYLHTQDGRKIIDAVSSWWVNTHGHANEYIAEAISKQARELEHVIFAGFTHKPAIELAENLLSILPENQKKVFYSDNGSTSVEVGLKMAFQYWYNQGITHKKKVIAFEDAYHGDTFGAMSVGGRSTFSAPFAPFLFDVEFMDLPVKGQEEKVLKAFQKLLESGEVAAFIFEPLVQGSAGMRMYSPKVLDEMIRLAHEHEVLCIADEVMTGFGRTGKLFASDYLENKPDIFCLSKGLTGGTMALGVTTCTEQIINAYRSSELMKAFFHGHSFTANPLACVVANASFKLTVSKECQDNIQRIQQRHEQFRDKVKAHPRLKDVRILGTVMAFEIKTKGETSYFNESRNALYYFFLERDILLRPLGNVIYILPPYIISDQELDKVYGAIEDMLELKREDLVSIK